MDCPVCNNVKLVMSERQGIEIDYCPNCRGVWLDRGELDKIIDKSAEAVSRPAQQPVRNDPYQPQQPQQTHGFGHSQPPQGYSRDDYYKKKRKKSFLGDLFDFD